MPELYAVKLNGVEIAVKTVAEGVTGLDTFVDGKLAGAGVGEVSSVNGKTGIVVLSASDVGALSNSTQIPTIPGVATETTNGLMSAADKQKLDCLPSITFEKVGTV